MFADRTVGASKISLPIAVEALWLVPSLRFPSLRRIWPARKVPLADPDAVLEPVAAPEAPSPPALGATAAHEVAQPARGAKRSSATPDRAGSSAANQ